MNRGLSAEAAERILREMGLDPVSDMHMVAEVCGAMLLAGAATKQRLADAGRWPKDTQRNLALSVAVINMLSALAQAQDGCSDVIAFMRTNP